MSRQLSLTTLPAVRLGAAFHDTSLNNIAHTTFVFRDLHRGEIIKSDKNIVFLTPVVDGVTVASKGSIFVLEQKENSLITAAVGKGVVLKAGGDIHLKSSGLYAHIEAEGHVFEGARVVKKLGEDENLAIFTHKNPPHTEAGPQPRSTRRFPAEGGYDKESLTLALY